MADHDSCRDVLRRSLAIAAVRAARTARHPLRWARCMAARIVRRVPGLPDDGEALGEDEMRAYIAICRGWKHDTEGSRT